MRDYLTHPDTLRIIRAALAEDLGDGDHTSLSTIPAGQHAKARCLIKGQGVLAGVAVAQQVIAEVDPGLEMEILLADGQRVQAGDEAFYVSGDPRSILAAERLLLNLMQRMSGIATLTRQVMDQLAGTNCKVLDTRKTTPLIRHFEKWAVVIGGGVNHRFGLYDMILIKDNHVDYVGGMPQALQAAKQYLVSKGMDLPIVVETRNLKEIAEVLENGPVTRILLDNMGPPQLKEAIALIDGRYPTEASGGITLETAREIAETGVDFISMGALTHSVQSMDISLKAMK